MYLHDNRVGLNDNMVDVASPSRLDGATLGANGDPQSHLRSTIAKLKAGLWVPCCIDAAAERLKIERLSAANRNPAQLKAGDKGTKVGELVISCLYRGFPWVKINCTTAAVKSKFKRSVNCKNARIELMTRSIEEVYPGKDKQLKKILFYFKQVPLSMHCVLCYSTA